SGRPDAAGRNRPRHYNRCLPDPGFVSGIIATAVGVSGTIAGDQRFYLIPFMTADATKPDIGDRCDIGWRWHSGFEWLLADGRSVREGRMVTNFHCEPASHQVR